MSYEIPPGLTSLLQEFTVAVLRNRPEDLNAFAAEYFRTKSGNTKAPQKNANASQNDKEDDLLSGNLTIFPKIIILVILFIDKHFQVNVANMMSSDNQLDFSIIFYE